ncbi:hypothetical protein OH76DRAFT_1366535 [Lentinus brumalis]|uniref:Uncharacterized protein n=1 Tax=Lentinus brumalis TaxID=2498619 RepID=A0A371CIW5_9APHY|nr:hypothetical protein OH76DRAFT_1366535 [Polyporus brumalis]
MSTQPNFLTIENAERAIVVPLSAMCAPYNQLEVQFTGSSYSFETGEVRWICCLQPHPDHRPLTPPTIPIIWELEGVISPLECFVTALGRDTFFDDINPEQEVVSFWLVARRRGDYISRLYWDQVLPAVQAIARSIPSSEVDLSEVIHQSPEDASVRLQLTWQPPHGESIESALPFYNKTGRRIVPASILDVPCDAVRVAFTVDYLYKYVGAAARPRTLQAVLQNVSVL